MSRKVTTIAFVIVVGTICGVVMRKASQKTAQAEKAFDQDNKPVRVFAEEAKSSFPGHLDFTVVGHWGHDRVTFVDEEFDGTLNYVIAEMTGKSVEVIKANTANVVERAPDGTPIKWQVWKDWETRFQQVRRKAALGPQY